jgi:integrase
VPKHRDLYPVVLNQAMPTTYAANGLPILFGDPSSAMLLKETEFSVLKLQERYMDTLEYGFRHAYGSLLKANGEDVKVVQDSLRHASSQITMDVYVQAIPSAVRSAHGRVVEMIAAELSGLGPALDPSSAAMSVND